MNKKINEKMKTLKGSFKMFLYPAKERENYQNYLVVEYQPFQLHTFLLLQPI